ncbi:MAG: hypothetical protein ABR503_14650, partial [Chitinophagaceae bacterium]
TYLYPIKQQVSKAIDLMKEIADKNNSLSNELNVFVKELSSVSEPLRRDVMRIMNMALDVAGDNEDSVSLKDYYVELKKENIGLYNT